MTKLTRDILYLMIIEELQDDKKTLFSCILVNKTWCEITIPILWRNPWKYLSYGTGRCELFKVIISHLSGESKKKLRQHKLLTKSYQKLSFNYISFCRHLDLTKIQIMINHVYDSNIYLKSEILIIQEEIFNLFINGNTNFTHLYILHDYQLHFVPTSRFLNLNIFIVEFVE